jgi:hypothetical protein
MLSTGLSLSICTTKTPIDMWRCYVNIYMKDRYQLNYFLYQILQCTDNYLVIFLGFVVPLCLFTFSVPRCVARYYFRIKRCSVRRYHQLFVGGIMSWLRYMCLLAHSGVQCILCFVFLRFVYPMLPYSLDCQLLIASLVFYNVYVNNN